MKIYGLTGTIGSGKSTVAKILRKHGAFIIDADKIARKVVEPGTAGLKKITESFGKDILNENGTLNRKKLAKIVFNDHEKLNTLNKIIHPKIVDKIKSELFATLERGYKIIIIEAALINSKGELMNLLNGLIVVKSNTDECIKRVVKRDNINIDDIKGRVQSQAKYENIIKNADYIINNSSDIMNLKSEVNKLWEKLNNRL